MDESLLTGRVGGPAAGRRARTCSPAASASAATGCSWPGTWRGELREPADRRGPARHHRHHAAAAADRVLRPAGHGRRGPDERGDPAAGRARGLHACVRVVQTAAVLSGLVPYGLFFLIVARLHRRARSPRSRRGALVQRVNAVESVSNVDVVCTDKTGTLTTGRLTVAEVAAARRARPARRSRTALGSFARSAGAPEPHQRARSPPSCPGTAVPVLDEVPFSSSLRWSARPHRRGHLGARRAGGPRAGPDAAPRPDRRGRARGPRRGCACSSSPAPPTPGASRCADADGRPALPALEPLALVALADELRPDVAETVARLEEEGIALKVLSGDDPDTVAALAARAGLRRDRARCTRAHLDGLDDAELDAVVGAGDRLRPGRARAEGADRRLAAPAGPLRRHGRRRRQRRPRAQGGPGRGGDAQRQRRHPRRRRHRPGRRLLAALLPARREGRRIISGIAISAQVFLTRVATQALVIVTVTMLGLGFPYSPAQIGLTLFTVGLPTLFLTAWARPDGRPTRTCCSNLARFVLPAAVLTAGFAVGRVRVPLHEHHPGLRRPATSATGWSPSSSSTPA